MKNEIADKLKKINCVDIKIKAGRVKSFFFEGEIFIQ